MEFPILYRIQNLDCTTFIPYAKARAGAGLTYIFFSRTVCDNKGLLCSRVQRSPCLHAPIL